MPKKRYKPEEIVVKLRQVDVLVPGRREPHGAARKVLKNGTRVEIVDVGGTNQAISTANEWVDSAELIVTPYRRRWLDFPALADSVGIARG